VPYERPDYGSRVSGDGRCLDPVLGSVSGDSSGVGQGRNAPVSERGVPVLTAVLHPFRDHAWARGGAFHRGSIRAINAPLVQRTGEGAFVLSMGLAVGYPMDAVITARFRRQDMCTRIKGERLLAFSNTANPVLSWLMVKDARSCGKQRRASWLLEYETATSATWCKGSTADGRTQSDENPNSLVHCGMIAWLTT
jgi:hypothetical protein